MNLCIDCIHFRRVQILDSKGVCRHPDSIISQSPIDGEVKYDTAENMRRGVTRRCGISAVLFEKIQPATPTPAPVAPKYPSPFLRMNRWLNISNKE